jgi:uncharacterized iron-regulated membrane protein
MTKKLFQTLHLWLGLTSGLLVFVIAITGSLYAFQEEITGIGKYHYVEELNKSFMLPSELGKVAEKLLPGKKLHAVKYNGKEKAVEAIFYGFNPDYHFIVYLNPYTGEVQKVKDMDKDFFRFIMQGHYYLWLPPQIGHPLVACSTLVFVLILLTGIVIWIPKNRNALKKRIWFRWKKGTKWPRINFDLHVVGGLYATVFALIFAITGLVWGFEWFSKTYYKVAGGKKSLNYAQVLSQNQIADSTRKIKDPLDKVWLLMEHEYPEATSIEVQPASSDSAVVAANANQRDGKYWNTDYRYFDQYTLREIPAKNIYGRFSEARFADKLMRMNYEIHTGTILGLPGKIFAFLMSLFIASFPVTGFILWWKKRKNKMLV